MASLASVVRDERLAVSPSVLGSRNWEHMDILLQQNQWSGVSSMYA